VAAFDIRNFKLSWVIMPFTSVSPYPSALRRFLLPCLCLAVLSACSESDIETQSIAERLRALGVGDELGQLPVRSGQTGEWETFYYDPAEERAICFLGDQYQVNIRRGTSRNLLIYLEGGGACWNYDTCYVARIAKTSPNPLFGDGILNAENPDNPLRDWNVVYGSYCDGSVFSGSNIVDYRGNRSYHHGLQNISAVVTLAQREFPNPDRIMVSGSSGGGYGTYSGYGVTRVAYPDAPIIVFNDSGPGLQNPDTPETNQERLDNWQFQPLVPPDCTDCPIQYSYLTDWALANDPSLRVSYFSYLQDGVIRFFLSLGADAYEMFLRDVTGVIHSRHPDRFQRFFIEGGAHTILELPTFYTTTSGGVSLRDWTADFISDGPRWQDVVE
jgi:hypothetical protein